MLKQRSMVHKIVYVLVAALILSLVYQHTPLFEQPTSAETHAVVYVNGSYSPAWAVWPWRLYLSLVYPHSEVLVFDHYYRYEDTPRARAGLSGALADLALMLDRIENDRIDIITHSYGAVLAHAALQSRPEIASRVGQVVTMTGPLAADDQFTDHAFLSSREHLGFDAQYHLPHHTALCGRIDTRVSCSHAVYPDQKGVRIWSNHIAFILPQLVSGRSVIKHLNQ